ncbi:transketolase family protein [Sedimentibacter hydroxybenzoicus DSM 7310]|uniref:Transketolase family protein n=1 Tax=Sedimentibacter hydroxybenzoicus DSM 7310 TaxID=1123245 RepID=A0A974BLV3_SEDHY|nr:transketolase family protein [Sedimentibacter hydroxybenzoicus]NYB75211.1 transketolase family protein [Sedimentibacter hydroxybenzoicus DSM 7310]
MAKATREAYGEALKKLAASNPNIVVLDADLSGSTKTSEFKKVSPERFYNVGIAEQNLIGTAAGMSLAGKIPFASTFAMFAAGRAFEIIRNTVAYPNLNVKIAATHAGLTVGEDGGSHQAIEDISLMRSIPNMTVISPADATEAEQAVLSAAEYVGPVYIRLGRMAVDDVYDDSYKFELGKGVELKKGDDITIIATGLMVQEALKAAKKLSEEGIDARVINIHTIKPIDAEIIIKAAMETKKIVTAEEHSIIGGLGSAVLEVLSDTYPVKVKRVGVMDTFGESGKPKDLLEKYHLTSEYIAKACKEIV